MMYFGLNYGRRRIFMTARHLGRHRSVKTKSSRFLDLRSYDQLEEKNGTE